MLVFYAAAHLATLGLYHIILCKSNSACFASKYLDSKVHIGHRGHTNHTGDPASDKFLEISIPKQSLYQLIRSIIA